MQTKERHRGLLEVLFIEVLLRDIKQLINIKNNIFIKLPSYKTEYIMNDTNTLYQIWQ